jgi:hypothetical protein
VERKLPVNCKASAFLSMKHRHNLTVIPAGSCLASTTASHVLDAEVMISESVGERYEWYRGEWTVVTDRLPNLV